MALSFSDNDYSDNALSQDDFDYEVLLKREFGDAGSEKEHEVDEVERLESLLGSVPANVLAALFCLMLWGGAVVGIVEVVTKGWREFQYHVWDQEKAEQREKVRTVLQSSYPKTLPEKTDTD